MWHFNQNSANAIFGKQNIFVGANIFLNIFPRSMLKREHIKIHNISKEKLRKGVRAKLKRSENFRMARKEGNYAHKVKYCISKIDQKGDSYFKYSFCEYCIANAKQKCCCICF